MIFYDIILILTLYNINIILYYIISYYIILYYIILYYIILYYIILYYIILYYIILYYIILYYIILYYIILYYIQLSCQVQRPRPPTSLVAQSLPDRLGWLLVLCCWKRERQRCSSPVEGCFQSDYLCGWVLGRGAGDYASRA